MADKIVPINGRQTVKTAFDEIRRLDDGGNEFWFATELLGLLGYQTWRRQKETVERAISACTNSGRDGSEHFVEVVQMAQIGGSKAIRRVVKDYRLSRFGAYLTAMNGDPRKTEIASAQSYFAAKTREAEVKIPVMTDEMRRLSLENENMQLKLKVYEAQTRTMAAASSLALIAPAIAEAIICPGVTVIEKVEHVDRTIVVDTSGQVVSQNDGVGISAIQKQFGFSSTKKAWEWLESIGYGKESGHWTKEMIALDALKLSRETLQDLKAKFAKHQGTRQRLLGE